MIFVLAQEDKNDGSANDCARRTPSPPSLTGRDACSHCVSDRSQLVIWAMPDRRRSSKTASDWCSTHGEHLSKCWILGALKDDLSRMSASCELTFFSLSIALAKSSQHPDKAESNVTPSNSGAPSRDDLLGDHEQSYSEVQIEMVIFRMADFTFWFIQMEPNSIANFRYHLNVPSDDIVRSANSKIIHVSKWKIWYQRR